MNKQQINKYMIKLLKTPNSNLKDSLNKIMLFTNKSDRYQITGEILKNKIVFGKVKANCTPHSLENICDTQFIVNPELPIIETIQNIIFWMNIYRDKIKNFVELKEEYEKDLFSGHYKNAVRLLEEIDLSIGCSIWSCGQKLILSELDGGLEANKKLLENFSKTTSNNILVQVLLEFYSNIAEDNMSYLNYQDNIKKYLSEFNDDSIIKRYLEFKLDFEKDFIKDDFTIIIQLDSQLSIIDLYNSYLELLPALLLMEPDLTSKINLAIQKQGIDDYRLMNLSIQNGFETKSGFEDYFNSNQMVYKIIEQYSQGNYSESLTSLETYLASNPNDFQMILLQIKSFINSKASIRFDNEFYQDIYNIYNLEGDLKKSFSNLYRYLKRYSGTTWKFKIKGLIARKQGLKNHQLYTYLSHLNDLVVTPNFVSVIQDDELRKKYLTELSFYCPETTKIYYALYCDNGFDYENIKMDNLRKLIYCASIEAKRGSYETAINLLFVAEKDIDLHDYYNLERVYRNLFIIYNKADKIKEIIQLTVKAYFININLIKRFDLNNALKTLKKFDEDDIKGDINYPIFVYICDKNDFKQHRIAYSNYLDRNNICDIDGLLNVDDNAYLHIFFLYKICTVPLLKRDIRLAGSSIKSEEIRVQILKKLTELDKENKKVYLDEINTITTEWATRDRLKQINESRIYVDVDMILNQNKEFWEESYKKYMSIKNFERTLTGIDISSHDYIDELKKVSEEMVELRISDANYNQELLVFKNIIIRIVDELLFNTNFGLETYLSSRIRHGYLKNQLTNLFYEYHLMSMTDNDKSGEYLINDYWDAQISSSTYEYILFKKNLSDFTFSIEQKVNEIKENWLHIRFKEGDVGDFDYSHLTNQCLLLDKEIFQDFNLFFDQIITIFWTWTDLLLYKLRVKIQETLRDFFIEELNELELKMQDLKDSELRNLIQEVISNINLAKSKIEVITKEFSNVFSRQNVSYYDFTMNDLITTCGKIAQKMQRQYEKINWNTNADSITVFSGKSFAYFVDILSILINNAIEHSGFEDLSDLQLKINIEKNNCAEDIEPLTKSDPYKGNQTANEYMCIEVSNNLGKEKDAKIITQTVDKIFEVVRDDKESKKYIQSEGGSGLVKLYKTFAYNISVPYYIGYNIEDTNFTLLIFFKINNLLSKEGEQL